jgi:ATP-dependent DNA helicase RecG
MKFSPLSTSKNPSLKPWEVDVQYLKGVGEKIGQVLKKNEIFTLWDFLFFLPKYYEDRRKDFSWGDLVTASYESKNAWGQVQVRQIIPHRGGRKGRKWTEVLCDWVGSDEVVSNEQKITFLFFSNFGLPIEKQFPVGSTLRFRGKVQYFRGKIQITHPELQLSEKPWPEYETGIVPVYREIGGLPNRLLRRIFLGALTRPEIDSVPTYHYKAPVFDELPTLKKALVEIHRPRDWVPSQGLTDPSGKYFQRLVVDELFLTSLSLLQKKFQIDLNSRSLMGPKPPTVKVLDSEILQWKNQLPYVLTPDQDNVVTEILSDLRLENENVPMHRLVQGDVGSGKTVVAFLAAISAMRAGYQVALMAPTEILATQHFENYIKFFAGLPYKPILLKGSLKAKEKILARQKIKTGEFSFVVGTQALIAEATEFHKLGLVIIDEQHRFGVAQRWHLTNGIGKNSGVNPHLLVMTATPIPRSLALTLYGDLNLSQIRNKPAGRIPIETHFVSERLREALDKRLVKFLSESRQIYCVFPLIEESEDSDLKSAEEAFERLQKTLAPFKVGLLHGKMKNTQKEFVMEAFRKNELQVLVSTTVIEVGVDVPNASVIVIENCDRFGLSQLHQLRGRVGRGSTKSYCVLVGSEKISSYAKDRIKVMTESDDGFVIAEKDLELRGPGEFLGQRQSGLPGFRVVHLLRDRDLLEYARQEAELLVSDDPTLSLPQNQNVKVLLAAWWGGTRDNLTYQKSG